VGYWRKNIRLFKAGGIRQLCGRGLAETSGYAAWLMRGIYAGVAAHKEDLKCRE
jgi:hypothetical protein